VKGAYLTVSHDAPLSQHPNKNVVSKHLSCWKLMPGCLEWT